jgi:hypothetical protein
MVQYLSYDAFCRRIQLSKKGILRFLSEGFARSKSSGEDRGQAEYKLI